MKVPRKLESQVHAAELAVTLPAFPTLFDPHCPDVVVHHGVGGGSCFPSSRKQLYRASPALPGPQAFTQLLDGLVQKTHPYSIVAGGASRLATAQAVLEATLGDVPFLGLSFNLQLENSGLQFWLSEC